MAENNAYQGGEVVFDGRKGCPVCLSTQTIIRKTDKKGDKSRHQPFGQAGNAQLEADFHDDFECSACGRHRLSESLSAELFNRTVSDRQREFVRKTPYNHFGERPMLTSDLPNL